MQDVAKAVLRGGFMVLNIYIQMVQVPRSNDLSITLKNQEQRAI